MVEEVLTIVNRSGLHTRPAASIVKVAAKFKSEIFLEKEGYGVNAKSIIGVMTLAAEQGSKLIAKADGKDEKEALAALAELFEDGFGEL